MSNDPLYLDDYVVIIEMRNPSNERYYLPLLGSNTVHNSDMRIFKSIGHIKDLRKGHPLKNARWIAVDIHKSAAMDLG